MKLTFAFRRVGFAALWLFGCSGETGSEGSRPAQGSPACQRWQTALCDWAGRCGAGVATTTDCRSDAASITCSSDDAALACAERLRQGTCQASTAQGCDLSDLADPAPARAACAKFVDAFCTSFERCGGGSKASCLVTDELTQLCDEAIGSTVALDECVQQLGTHPCRAEELPTACQGAILTTAPTH